MLPPCPGYRKRRTLTLSAGGIEPSRGRYVKYARLDRFAFDAVRDCFWLAGEALDPSHTATTVRIRNGKLTTTDGPFAETKEQLGGFYLVEATDLNEAIQIAARIPTARTGCVEVRPVTVFPTM